MATTFENFKGKIIFHAQVEVQDNKAERLQAHFKAIQDHILAGNEPGCLTYRLCRNGNHFLFFEEYVNAEAIKLHNESPAFQAFLAEVKAGALTVGSPEITFYEEV